MRTGGKKYDRRVICLCVLLAIGFSGSVFTTLIQGEEEKFPSKPVEMVIPYTPGGAVDLAARILVEFLSAELKVPVIIKNQPGGGGLVGAAAFLNTRPDGYSMLAGSNGFMINAVQFSKTPPFDPMKDFLPVGHIADYPLVMAVSKTSPFKSFDDFLQFAKSNPGKLKGAITTPGGEGHAMFLSILREAKIESKLIPYPGVGQMIAALLGGHMDWVTQTLPSAIPYIRSGDIRVLLLTRATPELPGIPAGSDKGLPSVSANVWLGFFVHPKTPKSACERLVSAIEAVTKNPEAAKKLANIGFEVRYKSPSDLSNLLKDQWESFARLRKETGMKVDY